MISIEPAPMLEDKEKWFVFLFFSVRNLSIIFDLNLTVLNQIYLSKVLIYMWCWSHWLNSWKLSQIFKNGCISQLWHSILISEKRPNFFKENTWSCYEVDWRSSSFFFFDKFERSWEAVPWKRQNIFVMLWQST